MLPAEMTRPESSRAGQALELVRDLQSNLANTLVASARQKAVPQTKTWLRDQGRHGGGSRLVFSPGDAFNRASINVSTVHYDDVASKPLASATAFSTIVHPRHPQAPSMHSHISWTERKNGEGYWRLMADLNPSLPHESATNLFIEAMTDVAGEHAVEARAEGDRYFYIPVLERHRGVAHFYLEGYSSDDFPADLKFARRFGVRLIEIYASILANVPDGEATDEELKAQLAYHSVYFLQVLTLDRGTTSGLLVHDQNDVGILASLPTWVDPDLLKSWVGRMQSPQDKLLSRLIDELPPESPARVDDVTRARLAGVIRAHYTAHPEALDLQASASIQPPTVQNHSNKK